MEEAVGCIGGFVLLAVVILVIFQSDKREKREREQFMAQERKFRKWSGERFGPNESEMIEILKIPNPFITRLEPQEKRRRRLYAERNPDWADEIIRKDKISRERQTEHFKSWGIERFEASWPKTSERLCRLVSANRTPSIDMLSDTEIETLNNYLLAETLGSVSPADTALVKSDDPDKPTRWTQLKCDNCGAPLLKGQCIYCNTVYTHE